MNSFYGEKLKILDTNYNIKILKPAMDGEQSEKIKIILLSNNFLTYIYIYI